MIVELLMLKLIFLVTNILFSGGFNTWNFVGDLNIQSQFKSFSLLGENKLNYILFMSTTNYLSRKKVLLFILMVNKSHWAV